MAPFAFSPPLPGETDAFISKGFPAYNHHNHQRRHHQTGARWIERFSFLGKGKPRSRSMVDTKRAASSNTRHIDGSLALQGCFSSRTSVVETTNSFQKVRAFAPFLPQLVRESDVRRLIEDERAARLASGCSGACLRGKPPVALPDQPLPEKLVVAVDVDEVLGNFITALNRFIADRYSSNHSVSEYHVYEFFKIWNCSRDEADIRVHEFFKTPYFKMGIHPVPGARQVLQKLSKFCNFSVVTSRQNAIKDHTVEWIEKHYPGLFQEIHFGNHFALNGHSRPKSDICRSLNAKILIDDNPRYAIECAEIGIKVLLFDYKNSYPWCKTESINQHPLVTKVHNWEEVEYKLTSWVASQNFAS